MLKYELKILYPSTNKVYGNTSQFFEITVYATHYWDENGRYRFVEGDKIIASYPIQYTIIEAIREIDVKED